MLNYVLVLVCPDGGSGSTCSYPVAGPVTFPSSMATSQTSIANGFSQLATQMVGYLALIAPVILGLALLGVGLKLFTSWSKRMADGEEGGEDFDGDDGDEDGDYSAEGDDQDEDGDGYDEQSMAEDAGDDEHDYGGNGDE